MKTQSYALYLTFALALVTGMVSCQKPDRTLVSGAQVGKPATGGGGEQGRSNGTADTGGGNGCDGKAYESYIVNPLELPAYTKYIQPMIENLDRQQNEKDSKADQKHSFANFFKMKTWYISCVDLQPIDKSVLGVSFDKNNTQQLAIQKDREIWIANKFFKDMSLEDQAMLVRHEFVMSLYFLKFKSLSEICKIMSETMGGQECVGITPQVDLLTPKAPLRPLQASDYENIRRVTGFLKDEGATAKLETIDQRLRDNGFDQRIFNSGMTLSGTDNEKMTAAAYSDIWNRAKFTNSLPDKCFFLESRKQEVCKLDFVEGNINVNKYDIPAFQTTIQSPSLPDSLVVKTFKSDDNLFVASSDARGAEAAAAPLYAVTFYSSGDYSNLKLGTKTRMNFVFLSRKGSTYNLEAYGSLQMVVTKLESTNPADKPTVTSPEYHPVHSTQISDDTIIIAKDGEDPTRYRNFIQFLAEAMR